MNVPTKLAAFGAVLVVAFTAAFGVGAAVGPLGDPEPERHHTSSEVRSPLAATADREAPGTEDVDDTTGGLGSSRAGYRLIATSPALAPGPHVSYRFRIEGPDGLAVTDFASPQETAVHLVVVRRDLSGYQHLHPTMDDDGTWTAEVDLSVPGTYRVLADFTPSATGEEVTLGTDLQVPGDQRPVKLPAPSRTAELDGYTVTLDGDLVPGTTSPLHLTVVSRDGPVTDLEPYLGAYGHLVGLRSGDVAYLNAEPDDGRTQAGPTVEFAVGVPSEGTYRLYLEFLHQGRLHRAEFTVVAGSPSYEAGDGHRHTGETG